MSNGGFLITDYMKLTEMTMSLNGEPKKVKVGEEFEMGGKKWMWEYKNDYAVTLVEKKRTDY